MECFSCRQNCPTNAIEIKEDITTCIRLLEGHPPIWIHEEKCNDCGKCAKTCLMGDITLSAETCSFCIICRSKPNCILPMRDRETLMNAIISLAGLIIIMPRSILKRNSGPALMAGH
jgi:NAD-dependent dihydropyrimidine dehydrogenase PreA subunit